MNRRELHPFNSILLLAFLTFTGVFVLFLLAIPLVLVFTGFNLLTELEIIQQLDSPDKILALKLFQLTSTIGIFIFPPVILYLFSGRGTFADHFKLVKPSHTMMWLLIPLLAWFSVPIINILGELNQGMELPERFSGIEEWMKGMETEAEKTTKLFTTVNTIGGLLFNLFLIAVLPSIAEELYFRGTLQPLLQKWTGNVHLAIWLTAIAFSALHFQFFGFLPRLFLGLIFGYLLAWSGSLWMPVLAHFVNNATVVIAYYLITTGRLNANSEDIGTAPGEMLPYLAGSSVLCVMIMITLYRKRVRKVETVEFPD